MPACHCSARILGFPLRWRRSLTSELGSRAWIGATQRSSVAHRGLTLSARRNYSDVQSQPGAGTGKEPYESAKRTTGSRDLQLANNGLDASADTLSRKQAYRLDRKTKRQEAARSREIGPKGGRDESIPLTWRSTGSDASSSTVSRLQKEASQVKAMLEDASSHDEKRARKKAIRAERRINAREVIAKEKLAQDLASAERNKPAEDDQRPEVTDEYRWKAQKRAVQEKLGGQAWNPRKRISPDSLTGIRSLHANDPVMYSVARLSEYFQLDPEAVRRILKSKWQPTETEVEDRKKRWEKRGEKKWTDMVEKGIRPPKKWRDMGVGRVANGETPKWRQKGSKGERWIEHRPPENLFAQAGAARTKASDITRRIL